MSEKKEYTVEDIIAELRNGEGYLKEGGVTENTLNLAARLENAWNREKAIVMEAARQVALSPTEVEYHNRMLRNFDRFKDEDEADKAYREEHKVAYAPAGKFIHWLFEKVKKAKSK